MATTNRDPELRGALFKNDKEGNDKRPDYKGEITIHGEKFWLSAWLNQAGNGSTYMSLRAESSVRPTLDPDSLEVPF